MSRGHFFYKKRDPEPLLIRLRVISLIGMIVIR